MVNLFVYGALMYDEVWGGIVSGDFEKINARLSGYRRFAVIKEEYPGIVKGEGTVEGIIRFNVDEENLSRLDTFEGEYYERILEQATDSQGNLFEVNVYRIKDLFVELLSDTEWDVAEFEKSGLKKFLDRYIGFDRVK